MIINELHELGKVLNVKIYLAQPAMCDPISTSQLLGFRTKDGSRALVVKFNDGEFEVVNASKP